MLGFEENICQGRRECWRFCSLQQKRYCIEENKIIYNPSE